MRAPSAARNEKRVAIVQSNYVPWKGYFDLIASVDEFILYDDVQYTRRDWRNRNRIKTAHGTAWLTIPVATRGQYHQLIRDVVVSDATWAEAHWNMLSHAYARAPAFADLRPTIAAWYTAAAGMARLSEINALFIREVCALLGIRTALTRSSDYDLHEGRSERLLHLCRQAGASTYVSGPSARGYLDERLFQEAGVAVDWMDYQGYPDYPQVHPPFEHEVSILDLLLNAGSQAASYMKFARSPANHA